MRKIKLGAIAVALTVATALPVEIPYSAGLVGAPAVEAGVISSIKGAAKKVGGAAKTVGGTVRKGAGSVIRNKKIGGLPVSRKGLKAFGRAVKSSAKVVGRTAKKGAKVVGKGLARVGRALPFGAKFNPRVSSTRGGHPNKSPAVQQRQR